MRAWTNKLFSLNHMLILSVFVMFAVFGIAIIHHRDNQTQPIQPKIVSSYNTNKSGVEFQKAYAIPTPVSDYVGDIPQQLASNTATIAKPTSSAQITRQASSGKTANPQQLVDSSQNKNNSLSSDLSIILSNISLNTK